MKTTKTLKLSRKTLFVYRKNPSKVFLNTDPTVTTIIIITTTNHPTVTTTSV